MAASPVPRILYVDDYEPMAEIVAETLADSGFDVTVAGDAFEALAACEDGLRFDAVVTDFNMPGIDGDELTRRLTQRHRIPVVVVTGQIADSPRDRALAAGARAVLDKREMMRRLPELLRSLLG